MGQSRQKTLDFAEAVLKGNISILGVRIQINQIFLTNDRRGWLLKKMFDWPKERENARAKMLFRAHRVAMEHLKKGNPRPAARLILSLWKQAKTRNSFEKEILGNFIATAGFQRLGQELANL
jgi:RNA polymerase-interacting CarD/CdnL/TRCF family regulator